MKINCTVWQHSFAATEMAELLTRTSIWSSGYRVSGYDLGDQGSNPSITPWPWGSHFLSANRLVVRSEKAMYTTVSFFMEKWDINVILM